MAKPALPLVRGISPGETCGSMEGAAGAWDGECGVECAADCGVECGFIAACAAVFTLVVTLTFTLPPCWRWIASMSALASARPRFGFCSRRYLIAAMRLPFARASATCGGRFWRGSSLMA